MVLVFALLFQVCMAAAMAGPASTCCSDSSTLAETLLAAPCCDDHGADKPGATSTETCFDAGVDTGGLHTADTPTCSSCWSDCGATVSPVVHAQPVGLPVIAAAFLPTPVRVTSHLPPTPHRLERPPSGRLR